MDVQAPLGRFTHVRASQRETRRFPRVDGQSTDPRVLGRHKMGQIKQNKPLIKVSNNLIWGKGLVYKKVNLCKENFTCETPYHHR